MKRPILYCLWVFFYGLCAGLGYVEQPEGFQAVCMTIFSVLFFLPPALLLIEGWKKKDKKLRIRIRRIALCSLVLTMGMLIANIAVVGAEASVGNVLYRILNFVSVPMICSRYYFLSMFLWACLLFGTFPKFVKPKAK